MTDLRERFRELDRLAAPAAWPDLAAHPGDEGQGDRPRRMLAALVALAVAAAGLGVAGYAFTRHRSDRPRPASVSGRARDIALSCTVRLLTPRVDPGGAVRTVFTYRNTGSRPLPLSLLEGGTPRLLVKHGGHLVYDTDFGPYATGEEIPRPMQPGAHVDLASGFRALWGGELALEPRCGYGLISGRRIIGESVIALSSLAVTVSGSGTPPDPARALEEALGRAGGLFDDCHPAPDGSVRRGTVPAPGDYRGVRIPAMPVSCRGLVARNEGFARVDLFFASPPDFPLPATAVEGPSRALPLPRGTAGGVIGRWTFLVTSSGAQPASPDLASLLRATPTGPDTRISPPPSCMPISGFNPCAAVRFTRWRDHWVSQPLPLDGPPVARPGIVFLLLPPSGSSVGPTILAHGEALGHPWKLSARQGALGAESGLEFSDSGAAAYTLLEPESQCPTVVPAGIAPDGIGPPSSGDWARFGAVKRDVARVSLALKDGRRVDGRIYPIPGSFHVPFDEFVAFFHGDFDHLELYDADGRPIPIPSNCRGRGD